MFCGNCGKQLKDNSKFCPYCGTTTGLGQTASPGQITRDTFPNQTNSPNTQPQWQTGGTQNQQQFGGAQNRQFGGAQGQWQPGGNQGQQFYKPHKPPVGSNSDKALPLKVVMGLFAFRYLVTAVISTIGFFGIMFSVSSIIRYSMNFTDLIPTILSAILTAVMTVLCVLMGVVLIISILKWSERNADALFTAITIVTLLVFACSILISLVAAASMARYDLSGSITRLVSQVIQAVISSVINIGVIYLIMAAIGRKPMNGMQKDEVISTIKAAPEQFVSIVKDIRKKQ